VKGIRSVFQNANILRLIRDFAGRGGPSGQYCFRRDGVPAYRQAGSPTSSAGGVACPTFNLTPERSTIFCRYQFPKILLLFKFYKPYLPRHPMAAAWTSGPGFPRPLTRFCQYLHRYAPRTHRIVLCSDVSGSLFRGNLSET